ncbi:Uncharacterised protein r2_g2881 [Pycnogonum litorale]
MEVIVSKKGGRKVCYQGHMYTLHAERQDGIWWKCVKRSSARCRGSLKTDLLCTNVIDGAATPHSHDPQPVQIRASKVHYTMKERAKVTAEAPGQIFANVVAGIRDDEFRAVVPVEEHVKRSSPCFLAKIVERTRSFYRLSSSSARGEICRSTLPPDGFRRRDDAGRPRCLR